MPNVRILATDLQFPEGPVAMPDGSVVLVEIRRQTLTRVYPDGRKEIVAKIPGGPNGAALGPDGKMYICNNGGFTWVQEPNGLFMPSALKASDYAGGSLQRVDMQSGKIETLFTHVGEHSLKGPNDLVFDRHGGLWFTDFGKRYERHVDVGGLYYMKPAAGEIVEAIYPFMSVNGAGLSPDEKTLYVADTPTARLWAFSLGQSGEILPYEPVYRAAKGRLIAGLGGFQMFDSLAVEANGNICVATLATGCISVISPDGKLIEQVLTGDLTTTNIAFGGSELKTAYITLSGKGQLIAMDWPRSGLPLNFLNK